MRLIVCAGLVLVFSIVVLCQSSPQSLATNHDAGADIVKSTAGFDPIVPRQVAEKLLTLDNLNAKTAGLSRLANLIWKRDQDFAHSLFEKALALTTPQTDSNNAQLMILRRNVIRMLARNDPEWAKRLIDTSDAKIRNSINVSTASSLIDEDPGLAVEFAQRGLQEQLNPSYLYFLLSLRKADKTRADQTFLQMLTFLGQQQRPDIKSVHLIGVYLFTAADMLESENYAITRVDNILVPNITAQRTGVSPALVRAYLKTAGTLLLRAATDTSQQQVTYALGRLLLPKAKLTAPDLAGRIEAAMAAVSSGVPASLTNDTAYKYIDSAPPTPAESFANAELKPTQEARDIAFLDIAAQAWRKSDFKNARKAASMIENAEANRTLRSLVDFGEAASLLKRDDSLAATAEKAAYKLSPGLERAILLLTISQYRVKSGNTALAEEAIDASLKAAAAVSDIRRPCLHLIAASHLAQLHSSIAPAVTVSAIKELNSFDNADYAAVEWNRIVEAGPLKASFSLEVPPLNLNLDSALRAILLSDLDLGFARAQEIKNENLRARALVEFVAVYLDKLNKQTEKEASQGDLPIRVGEDGIRKSASKTVMPEYPEDAQKKRQKGPAIVEVQYDGKGEVTDVVVLEAPATSIGDAVSKAVWQWRFIPSKDQNGKPVNIRGKLTFYFSFDSEGKPRVENPKQFR